jgi:hypothetical protein
MPRAQVTLRRVHQCKELMLQCTMSCNDVLLVACGIDQRCIMTIDNFDMTITVVVMSLSISLVSLRLATRCSVMSCRRLLLCDGNGNSALEPSMTSCLGTWCDTVLLCRIEYASNRWDMEIFGVNTLCLPRRACACGVKVGLW